MRIYEIDRIDVAWGYPIEQEADGSADIKIKKSVESKEGTGKTEIVDLLDHVVNNIPPRNISLSLEDENEWSERNKGSLGNK